MCFGPLSFNCRRLTHNEFAIKFFIFHECFHTCILYKVMYTLFAPMVNKEKQYPEVERERVKGGGEIKREKATE